MDSQQQTVFNSEATFITKNDLKNSTIVNLTDLGMMKGKSDSNELIEYPQSTDIPSSDMRLARLAFVLIGISGALNWSIILNSILSVFTTVYSFPRGADTILIGYFLLSLVVAFFRIKYRTIETYIVYAGIGCLILTNVFFPLIIQFTSGILGIILLHILLSITGLGISLVVSSNYAYSSMLPINFTGYSFAGNGFAGLMGFLTWQFITRVFFDVEKVDQVQYAAWTISAFALLSTIITIALFYWLTKRKWFQASLKIFQLSSKILLDPELVKSYKIKSKLESPRPQLQGVRPLKYLMRNSFSSLGICALSFFISFSVFPQIGPYDWNGRTLNAISLLVGIYQTLDFLGRYMGNLSPKLRMPWKYLTIFALCRISFLPIFILLAIYENPVTTNFYLQIVIMLVFSISHGISSSQAVYNVPRSVETLAERGIMGIFINISNQLGVFLAIFFLNFLKNVFII